MKQKAKEAANHKTVANGGIFVCIYIFIIPIPKTGTNAAPYAAKGQLTARDHRSVNCEASVFIKSTGYESIPIRSMHRVCSSSVMQGSINGTATVCVT